MIKIMIYKLVKELKNLLRLKKKLHYALLSKGVLKKILINVIFQLNSRPFRSLLTKESIGYKQILCFCIPYFCYHHFLLGILTT
jgi:hypothetical protein